MLSRVIQLSIWVFFGFANLAMAGPLQDAARAGDIEQIKQLLAKGADINQSAGVGTALWYAIKEDHPEAAVFLIQHGADVNARTPWGTPLHAAAAEGLEVVTHSLLE